MTPIRTRFNCPGQNPRGLSMIIQKGSMLPPLKVEFLPPPTDPVELAKLSARLERAQRNSNWLQAHWGDLLPQAAGKHVIVAGEEAFIADSVEEAWAWAKQAHPEDDGAMLQYVNPERGIKIYANHW
jgi:hypothetical protein